MVHQTRPVLKSRFGCYGSEILATVHVCIPTVVWSWLCMQLWLDGSDTESLPHTTENHMTTYTNWLPYQKLRRVFGDQELESCVDCLMKPVTSKRLNTRIWVHSKRLKWSKLVFPILSTPVLLKHRKQVMEYKLPYP